jgi:thymidylate kinase
MVFVDTPVNTAIERNKNRGRKVDEDFLKKAYDDSQKLKNYYSTEFKNFTEILNGVGELTDKVIVDAYKKMEKFFLSPIENPIGQQLKEEMLDNG